MRVLVAGGAGYIGSVVTAALLQAGHEVTVLDDLSTGHADAVPSGARLVQASLHDSAPVLADVRPEAVLHFAAKSLVGESHVRPEIYWNTNVTGTLALLEAMRAVDCRRIVLSSTAPPSCCI
jgi:UDP-glucose 4-epimerase